MKHRPAPDDDWRDVAACRKLDPVVAIRIFYPEQRDSVEPAKEICRTCVSLAECRQWALDNHEIWGVLGGMSQRERQRWWRHERHVRAELRERPINHGTLGGYNTHSRRGEPACQPCRDAYNRQAQFRKAAKRSA